jgi:hypothetical protein
VQFRSVASAIAPYIAFDLRQDGKLPLVEVIHAPAEEPELRKRILCSLLLAHGYERDVAVNGSTIPLRRM